MAANAGIEVDDQPQFFFGGLRQGRHAHSLPKARNPGAFPTGDA
jgi:hypothetical protein